MNVLSIPHILYRTTTISLLAFALTAPLSQAADKEHAKHSPQDQADKKEMSPAEKEKTMREMQGRMLKMHELMHKIQDAKEPVERQKLMDEHMKMMEEQMQMMRGHRHGGMMGGDMPMRQDKDAEKKD